PATSTGRAPSPPDRRIHPERRRPVEVHYLAAPRAVVRAQRGHPVATGQPTPRERRWRRPARRSLSSTSCGDDSSRAQLNMKAGPFGPAQIFGGRVWRTRSSEEITATAPQTGGAVMLLMTDICPKPDEDAR